MISRWAERGRDKVREVVIVCNMGNPACEKCKPDKPETHERLTKDTGCEAQYKLVSECMQIHKGNVKDCKEQWDDFRKCFKESKKHWDS